MTFLVLLFGLAGMIWAVHLARAGNVPLGGLAVLLLGTIFGPAFFAINGPLQISADRVLWVLVIGMFVFNWRMGKTSLGSLTRGDWVLIFFVAWLAISTKRGGPVPEDTNPVARWLFYICMPMGLYWTARASKCDANDLKRIMNALVILGVYLGLTGICEMKGWHALVFPKYIVDPKIWEFYGRARGPLLNPAGNGILMAICLGAAGLRALRSDRIGKLLYGVAAGIISAGIYATLTRGCWIGGLAAIGIITLAHVPRSVRIFGVVSVLIVGLAFTFGLKDQLLQLKRDKNLSAAEAQKSLQLRPLLAIVAFEMFKDKPVAGFGYGHYFAHSAPYHSVPGYGDLDKVRPYMQHNVFLSILVDTGLLGLIPLLIVLGYWLSCSWRLSVAKQLPMELRYLGLLMLIAMSAYFVNGMFQDVSVIPMVHMFLFFLAGLIVGNWTREQTRPQSRHPAVAPTPPWTQSYSATI